MHTFPFLNQRRRARLVWPWVTAVIGCIVFANAFAQSATAHDSRAMSAASTNVVPTYLRDIQPIFMGQLLPLP